MTNDNNLENDFTMIEDFELSAIDVNDNNTKKRTIMLTINNQQFVFWPDNLAEIFARDPVKHLQLAIENVVSSEV